MTGVDDGPKGPFTLWMNNGCEGWSWMDFESVEAALSEPKHTSNFVIQAPVAFKIKVQSGRKEPLSTARTAKWRAANREKSRDYQREYMREWRKPSE